MKYLPVALALVAALLGWGWLRSHDAEVRAVALAEQRLAALDSSHAATEALRVSNAQKDRHNVELQEALATERAAAEVQRAAAQRRESQATAAVATARAALDAALDSLGPRAESARAELAVERAANASLAESLRGQVTALTLQLAVADSALVLERDRLTARDQLIASLEATLAEERGLREFYQGRAEPGFFAELRDDLPKVVGAFGLGYLAKKVL